MLAEKPIAKDVASAQSLIEFYNNTDKKATFGIAENFRFLDSYSFASEVIGSLGHVLNFRIRFATLGGEARLARAAAVEKSLDVACLQGKPGRAAVDHAAQRRPMALAPGGHAQQMAERIVRHGRACSGSGAAHQGHGLPSVFPKNASAVSMAAWWV